MGAVRKGGEGCACPENVLLKNLLSEIILERKEVVIVDMEAGIEHLGRAPPAPSIAGKHRQEDARLNPRIFSRSPEIFS